MLSMLFRIGVKACALDNPKVNKIGFEILSNK
jgi:hypothetical protein